MLNYCYLIVVSHLKIRTRIGAKVQQNATKCDEMQSSIEKVHKV